MLLCYEIVSVDIADRNHCKFWITLFTSTHYTFANNDNNKKCVSIAMFIPINCNLHSGQEKKCIFFLSCYLFAVYCMEIGLKIGLCDKSKEIFSTQISIVLVGFCEHLIIIHLLIKSRSMVSVEFQAIVLVILVTIFGFNRPSVLFFFRHFVFK